MVEYLSEGNVAARRKLHCNLRPSSAHYGQAEKKGARLISANPTAIAAGVGSVSNTCRQSSRYNFRRLCGVRPRHTCAAADVRKNQRINPVRFRSGPPCGCRRFATVHHAPPRIENLITLATKLYAFTDSFSFRRFLLLESISSHESIFIAI